MNSTNSPIGDFYNKSLFKELGSGYVIDLGVSGGLHFECCLFCTSPSQFTELISGSLPIFLNQEGNWIPSIDISIISEGFLKEGSKQIDLILKPDGYYYNYNSDSCFDRRNKYPCVIDYSNRVLITKTQKWEYISLDGRHFLYDSNYEKPTSSPDVSDILPIDQMKNHTPRFIEVWIEHSITEEFEYCSKVDFIYYGRHHRMYQDETYFEQVGIEVELCERSKLKEYLANTIKRYRTLEYYLSSGDNRVLLFDLLPVENKEASIQCNLDKDNPLQSQDYNAQLTYNFNELMDYGRKMFSQEPKM